MFVHGLSGHPNTTWQSSDPMEPMWPKWLEGDIPGVGLWVVGYPAAKTNWGGHSMPLADRAGNILALLLAEPRLAQGNIAFVTHSLGGLVVEQTLRTAERDSETDRRAHSFLSRVKKVAFLGTPHRGALLASVLTKIGSIVRASASTRDLITNNPQLRDLNLWYRAFSANNGVENLQLAEGRPETIMGIRLPDVIGTIVQPNSSDAGLPELPIFVDESHRTICSPASRGSEVYIHVRDFLGRSPAPARGRSRLVEAVETNTTTLQELISSDREKIEKLGNIERSIENLSWQRLNPALVDSEVERRLQILRKTRMFGGADPIAGARKLAADLRTGNLSACSAPVKSTALAWCARLLALTNPEEADGLLLSIDVPDSELVGIARGLVTAAQGKLDDALASLTSMNTEKAIGSAFILVLRDKGWPDAEKWLHASGLDVSKLDSDARFYYIKSALDGEDWETAYEESQKLSEPDLKRTPALLSVRADATLMLAVPEELRLFLLQFMPFDLSTYPLRGDPASFDLRRRAVQYYEQLRDGMRELGLSAVAANADDKALWLRLMDPETRNEARDDLRKSLQDPSVLLRRLNFALRFGIAVDLDQVEQEVDRQTALSGGSSGEAAFARYVLAHAKPTAAEAAAYLDRHRTQLLRHLEWKAVYFFEIEALARAGERATAEERFAEATSRGLTEQETAQLRRLLEAPANDDPINHLMSTFKASGLLSDLRTLVVELDQAEDWEKIAEYGKLLLDKTDDLTDAQRYAGALYNLERQEEVLKVFDRYPALLATSPKLKLLHARVLVELGYLDEARTAVSALRSHSDSEVARNLSVTIAVVSGDWEALQGFVETEWTERDHRTALELLRTGQLAQQVGAARAKEFVREAAMRSPDDAQVLMGAYHIATSSGWENTDEVHGWFQRAAQLSEGMADPPVLKMSIEDLIDEQPEWGKRTSDTWDNLVAGKIPLFAAARLLGRSLVSLHLLPAVANLVERDPRKRSSIYSFSGARRPTRFPLRVVAMDITALLTAAFLDAVNEVLSSVETVFIPHNTLSLLFEEKSKILFHQPSRVAEAQKLRRLISDGNLRVFESTTAPPESLAREVGDSLAELLVEAASPHHDDGRQRLVVRGGPIYRVSTFMKEEADLRDYTEQLCSCLDIVEKLSQKGLLRVQEVERARAALSLREVPWEPPRLIPDGAVLYLDDLTVAHLQFLGLLNQLHKADLVPMVHSSEVDEIDALIGHDALGDELLAVVEKLRSSVREALDSGKIKLGKAVRVDEEGPRAAMAHPTLGVLRFAGHVDAAVVDDRFINQHAWHNDDGSQKLAIVTTLDVLNHACDQGTISPERLSEALTKLRQAAFLFIPITLEELSSLLRVTEIIDGKVIERAELRALRESILLVRMRDVLQVPGELAWLEDLHAAMVRTLSLLWQEPLDEFAAKARSDWLLDLVDVKGWSHRLDESSAETIDRYRRWIAGLMLLSASRSEEIKASYWDWLQKGVLDTIQSEDPETFAFLVNHAKEVITQLVSDLETKIGALS
nr:hypothetical protein [Neorhizobium huautlense]